MAYLVSLPPATVTLLLTFIEHQLGLTNRWDVKEENWSIFSVFLNKNTSLCTQVQKKHEERKRGLGYSIVCSPTLQIFRAYA